MARLKRLTEFLLQTLYKKSWISESSHFNARDESHLRIAGYGQSLRLISRLIRTYLQRGLEVTTTQKIRLFFQIKISPTFWTLMKIKVIPFDSQTINESNQRCQSFKDNHFEKILEIKNIYDLDKNFNGNSHCVNAFQTSRYLCFGQKKYFQFLVCVDRRVVNLYKI